MECPDANSTAEADLEWEAGGGEQVEERLLLRAQCGRYGLIVTVHDRLEASMTLSDIASIATVVSSIAVLGSLVYLAYQTRQNTRHTRALIQQARNQQIIDFNLGVATNPAVNELFLRGGAGDPTLTSGQALAYLSFVMAQLAHAEDGFYQHRDGLIDDERYSGSIAFLQNVLAPSPGFRAAWKMCKGVCGPEFRAFAEKKIREAASVPMADAGAQWLSTVALESVALADGVTPLESAGAVPAPSGA